MKRITILFVLFFISGFAAAQDPKEDARKIATELLAQYPGLSIAVGINDKIVWSEGLGFSDVANKVKVSENTTFPYYSLSKSITGIALAKLVSSGQLDITKYASYYLPNLPLHYKNVTVAQLIGHSAGVRHYKKGEWMKISKGNCITASESFATFINDPLVQEPGTAFQYSTFGYVILSNIIEAITKTPYNNFIEKEICNPIGVTDIALDQTDKSNINKSIYYENWNNEKSKAKVADDVNNSCKMGGGGLTGSAKSLVMLHLSILNGKILNEKAKNIYYTSLPDNNGQSLKYSFGLKIAEKDGSSYFSHTGSGLGGNGVILIYPDKKAVIVILGNIENNSMNAVAGKVLSFFLN
jgi:serine beta-lactamase-like protein LACTB, mitochondrial